MSRSPVPGGWESPVDSRGYWILWDWGNGRVAVGAAMGLSVAVGSGLGVGVVVSFGTGVLAINAGVAAMLVEVGVAFDSEAGVSVGSGVGVAPVQDNRAIRNATSTTATRG